MRSAVLGLFGVALKAINKENGNMQIGMRKVLAMSFEDAVAKAPEALKTEGFGVLTEIDVQKTLAQKLQVPFRRYRIMALATPRLLTRRCRRRSMPA